jgi:hypothetical protein
VKSGEHISSASQQASRMFRYHDALLYPNLGEPLSKSEDRELAFFLTAYAPSGDNTTPAVVVEIVRAGHPVYQRSCELPAPDPMGRIQYAGAIPLEKLEVGDFELRVIGPGSKPGVANAVRFTVQP